MITKPQMRFIATTSDKLTSISIRTGQLIFCLDTRVIYLDTSSKIRTSYQSIMTVKDDDTRKNMKYPIEGYYYVRTENALWSYFDGLWVQMTGQKSNLIFSDEGLPAEGEKETLYVENTSLYRWNDITNSYEQISGNANWEDIDN